jgi:hypothetical protein
MVEMQAALVKSILEKWRAYEWTVQGFGFIRTKIDNIGRIHVWGSRLAVPLVSTAHTHPWPLLSTIISGELINQRFVVSDTGWLPYMESDIKTREGGGLTGEPRAVLLESKPPETYCAGQRYKQLPDEIHRTIAQDGTVTLLERPQGPPLELAQTYWPRGTEWVSAEPKKITEWELQRTIDYALARWCSTNSGEVKS